MPNLYKNISRLGIKNSDYHIIRYRDDYRIFVREPKKGDEIMKALSEELALIGMRLNPVKTKITRDVITGSIKPEKLHYLQFPMPQRLKVHELKKQLLVVLQVNELYPNSGATVKRLTELLALWRSGDKYPLEAVSILVNIAVESPISIPVVAAFISRLIKPLDKGKKEELCKKIMRKIKLLPNSGLLEIWLQRILIKSKYSNDYAEKLCLLAGGKGIELFNNEWLPTKKLKELGKQNMVDEAIIKSLDEVISKKEIELFKSPHYS